MTPSQICSSLIITIIFVFDQRVQCHKDAVSDNASSGWSPDGLQDSWPFRFLANIGGYLWVIVPLSLLVYLVKRGYLSEGIRTNKYIRLIVYGNEVDGIPYAQLPITNASTVEMSSEEVREKWIKDVLRLLFCFVGLQVSYLTWGLLQEKIMTQEYLIEIAFFSGHHEHVNGSGLISVSHIDTHPDMYSVRFLNSQFLVFINRVLAFLVASSVLVYSNRRHLHQYFLHSRQPALYMYSYCSLSNILSSWCQYEALKYVSFPVQVLSKGCKMLAVMLMSVCISKKKYKPLEWFFGLTISFGIWLFLLNEEQASKHRMPDASADHSQLMSGIFLLALYLTFDSFTSNWQSDLFERYTVSSIHMMASVNFYSILFTSISLTSQSEFVSAFRLLLANSALARECLILSLCSALGQLFVYHTISSFGAVVFTLIMTLRQVFAILLSIFNFGHSISVWGALGITIVFASIFSNMWIKYQTRVNSANSKLPRKNKAQA